MVIVRVCSALAFLMFFVVPGLSAQTPPGRDSAEPTPVTLITESDRVRFITAGPALEWRLEIVDAHSDNIFDSSFISTKELDWPLVDAQGQPIETGLYTYTLTIRSSRSNARIQRGHLQIERVHSVYQIAVLSSDSTGDVILTTMEAGGPPASASTLISPSASFRRSLNTVSFAPQPLISGSGETNHMTKWLDGPAGVVGDANVTELNGSVVIGNGTYRGNLHLYGAATHDVFAGMGPDLVSGPAFNFGYAGESFGRGAGFFNVRPDASAVAPNPSVRFMTANVQRMIITNTGRVGIGTTNPTSPLEVRGTTNVAIGGYTTTGIAIYGESSNSEGVRGVGVGDFGRGVTGLAFTGVGLSAQSVFGDGILVEGRTVNPPARVFHITTTGTYVAGSDFAEALPVDYPGEYEPGDVLIVSEQRIGRVGTTTRPYDPRVVGIYSTRPGMLGADKNGTSRVDADEVPVAIMGIVPTKVCAENGPIHIGDLLTTSSTPGHAMKVSPVSIGDAKIYPTGTILGKALEPLYEGRGVIKVLVTLK